ncbi:hypothetical protein FDN13_08460 [Caloramator sp. E03]|uniref:PD40 domain-containing protein n=1 Tax=Caloramator sp. E03 TaxID=2576307 RepID=UPI00111088C8|nr:PD40 domain-containing protein [Caloramator sp. E03]QCX33730.1 hypothetical protein FDN13_08460 [Caloramator sp. E03]
MKKWFCIVLIFILIFMTGCPDNEKEKSNDSNKVEVEKSENIDKKAANVFVNNYLTYVLKGDLNGMKSFYADDLKGQIKDVPVIANSRPVSYKMESGDSEEGSSNEGKTVNFKVHIYNSGQDMPYFSDDLYNYTVGLQEGKMVITKIEKEKSTEIYEKDKALYKREGDKIKGEKVLSLADMQEYISLSNTLYPGQKIPLPKDSFGPCGISPDGKSILITTKGIPKAQNISGLAVEKGATCYFVGLITMKENEEEQESIKKDTSTKDSKQVVKLEEDKTESKGASKSEEGSKQQPQEEEKTTKEQLTVKTLDFYVGWKIKTAAFSPDGKTIMIEYIQPSGLNRIKLYKTKEGEPIELIIDKQFLPDRFGIASPYFISPQELVFTIVPAKDATSEEEKFKGQWEFDLKEQKLKQY